MVLSYDIPCQIRNHLENSIILFGLDSNSETMNCLISGWKEKETAFEEQILNLGLIKTDSFNQDDERGLLALTYSGSLLCINPIIDGKRSVDYISIGLRKNIHETYSRHSGSIIDKMIIDKGITFDNGRIQQTPPIYKIAVCPENLSQEKQEKIIEQAKSEIIDQFTDINERTILQCLVKPRSMAVERSDLRKSTKCKHKLRGHIISNFFKAV